jgi:tyrosinase
MLRLSLWAAANFAGSFMASPYPADVVDKLAEASMGKLKDYLTKNP